MGDPTRLTSVGGVNDETFTAIVLRAPMMSSPGRHVYFRYPEHGGVVEDPIHAHRCHIDRYLWDAEAAARRYFPQQCWERARLIVDVQPFSDPVIGAMDEIIRAHVRREALAKLTDLERVALGLELKP